MIIINRTLAPLIHEGQMILPGTNVFPKFNEAHPIVKQMISDGKIMLVDEKKATENERHFAVEHATSESVISELKKIFSFDSKLKNAMSKKEAEISEFGKEFDKALEDSEKKDK